MSDSHRQGVIRRVDGTEPRMPGRVMAVLGAFLLLAGATKVAADHGGVGWLLAALVGAGMLVGGLVVAALRPPTP